MMTAKLTNAMKWKLRLIANVFIWSIIFSVPLNSFAQNQFVGIKKPSSANPYWDSYSQESKERKINDIKEAIALNIKNFSLFEYSFVLEELLQSYTSTSFRFDVNRPENYYPAKKIT